MMSGIENLPDELSDTIANWFMVYGTCKECMIEDNGGHDDPELDFSEAVPESQCRRCFTGHLYTAIEEKINPTIETKFCPTGGKPKDEYND